MGGHACRVEGLWFKLGLRVQSRCWDFGFRLQGGV